MGRNYAENSLKKFLKRKVKITMGVVVSFLITGAVAFGAEPQEPTINADGTYIPYNKHVEISKEWLKGIGENKIVGENINFEGIEVINIASLQSYNRNISDLVLKNINSSLTLINQAIKGEYDKNIILNGDDRNDYLSGLNLLKTSENLEVKGNEISVIEKGTVVTKKQYGEDNSILVNKGIIKSAGEFGQRLDAASSKVYNYGVIANSGKSGQYIGYKGDNSIGYNFGIILNSGLNGQETNGKNSLLYNYGIIKNNGWYGQGTKNPDLNDNVKLYNYGIIANTAKGQYTEGSVGGDELYNFGLIINNGNEGQLSNSTNNEENKNAKLYNYGVIANNGEKGQSAGKFTELHNYGIIANKKVDGQSISENGIGYNYGIIQNLGDFGQHVKSEQAEAYNYGKILNGAKQGQNAYKGKIYNYGIIANNGDNGQSISENGVGYNYGIIANKGNYAMLTDVEENSKGYNYGIIYKENENIFSQNIIDKGIVIVKDINNSSNINLGDGEIRGVLVSSETMELLNNKSLNKHVLNLNSENSNQINGNEDKSTYFIKDKSIIINSNSLENKVLTGIVKDKENTTLFNAKDDLTLTDSSIVGYFEKDGTLLEVNGNLTLSGESVINAIAGNEYTGYKGNALNNVVAVKLKDNGTLTIEENSKVLGLVQGNGIAVLKNSKEYHNNGFDTKGLDIKTTEEKGTKTTIDNLKVTEGVLISGDKTSKENTKITFGNNINIIGGISFNEHGTGGGIGADITLGDGQASSDKTINIDSITLGTESDILTINNALKEVGVIDGKDGDDIVNLKNLTGTYDTFDYQLKNIETLDLNNQTWKIGANANISHDTTTKAGDKTTIQNGTLMGELKGTVKDGVEFVNNKAVNSVLENSTFGDNAKFQIGIGKDMELVAGGEYDIADTTVNNLKDNVGEKNITASAIFTKATEQGKDIRVKSAKEMNIDERYSGIYEEMLENASSNSEILNVLNSTDVSSIANAINEKGALGDTLATTGYKITRDISNSFMSAVNEWDKKANKGEWLANAKYINSDVEYDGANKVKGYDSDIKSMVGMIEYGVSDNTSLGIALGGGDTEIDVKDAGTLKGDNYYIGAYAKHSVNGFDLTGNLGYTISDLEVNGKGSADSSAITLGGYIKRDIALTETVRLEPNLSFTYDYIMQDNAEGNGVKVDNKDVHVFEAGAGMNIVKEFNFEKGVLELEAGVKYSMADVNRNEETVISVYGIDDINLGNPEVDKTRGTAHVGFDYEHETGFGVNGKYETMWSDSGDDSRITAGISYRF